MASRVRRRKVSEIDRQWLCSVAATVGARTRIAVATRSPAERATFSEWLNSGGFEAVPVRDIGASTREIEALNFEMLVVDIELMTVGALMRVARLRATPRPVVVIGEPDPEAEADAARRGASYLVRPIERAGFVFAVTLALAEGRPMRRSPRKRVSPLPGSIDGIPSRVLDVSHEGVRIEIAARHRGSLPPHFRLRVPVFNVAIAVRRVWVSTVIGASSQLCCGCALSPNPQRSVESWRSLVDLTPGIDIDLHDG
jgi:CheY-like chemotaxis protein